MPSMTLMMSAIFLELSLMPFMEELISTVKQNADNARRRGSLFEGRGLLFSAP